jgi:hypothetical protein
MILTGLFIKDRGETINLDDPKVRQRYTRDLNPKQRLKFAKFYIRQLLEAQEYERWYKRMLWKK